MLLIELKVQINVSSKLYSYNKQKPVDRVRTDEGVIFSENWENYSFMLTLTLTWPLFYLLELGVRHDKSTIYLNVYAVSPWTC